MDQVTKLDSITMAPNVDLTRGEESRRAPSKVLREMISSPDLSFLMEAHNGLSARIVAEAGFEGIWASGLSIATAFGVRDRNEASWTQVVDVLEFMTDATDIPVLVDGDTGYGDFNSVRRLVKKLCQRKVAGVCLEDKNFPKTNSFLGNGQALCSPKEFCGKIKAAQDAKSDGDFCVVARTEALVSGLGQQEAIERAHAYYEAGADAILIHSKQREPDEILEFAARWQNRGPLVIVPTKYFSTPVEIFERAGISTVIWANHNLRASLTAMQSITKRIRADRSVACLESEIAKLDEVFRIVDTQEIEHAELRYAG
jgi:phosphoenolpyruvate phosphomutase